jgi:hypothetical protein
MSDPRSQSEALRGRALTCRIVVPAKADACGEPATHLITWSDDDRTPACTACTAYLRSVSETSRAPIRISKLTSGKAGS